MAREFNQDYYKATLNRPIPGESLYDDPDSPSAYEGPTKFTTIQKASQYLFDQLTEEDNYVQFLEVAGQGMPLVNIAKTVLYDGFQKGLWNPDLLMLLVEPFIYIMAALLERADIDFVIEGEDGDDENVSMSSDYSTLENLQEGKVPPEIKQQIEEVELPEVERPPSLLGGNR